MLRLLQSPAWVAPAGPVAAPVAVPATVPGALLLCLAAHGDGRGDWVDRETVVALFWPDRPPAEGQRNLRANLHRLRALLATWGCEAALGAERTRLRLALPTDLAALADAVAGADATALLAHAPRHWLQGYRLPGFAELRGWFDDTGAQWRSAWRAACARALERAPGPEPADLRTALRDAWHEADDGAPGGAEAARPASQPAARECALAGRTTEQARLRHHAGPALVVLGEPGIGKTRLLTSTWPGAPLLKGREGLGNVPYAPLLEWLRGQPAVVEAALRGPQAALAAYRLDLARLLPEIARGDPLPPLDAQSAKARLLEALARLFEAQGPVLLVDDLQWLDVATLEWLVLLTHRHRLPWRGTARRHELTGPARQACDSLQAARLLQFQALDGLDDAAFAAACRAGWPQRGWTPAVLDGLRQASAGNPFVLGELLAQGADGALARGEPIALPRRVLELVGQRLRQQPAPVRAVVEAAAVMATPATAEALAQLCEGLGEAEAADACDEAVAAGLLAEEGATLQCRHDLIRSTAMAGLGAARRRWLHRRAALALGAAGDADPLIVAGHWEQARELQTALAWVHRGAEQQKERGRFDDAKALWQRVAAESLNATQALRARLALAECELRNHLDPRGVPARHPHPRCAPCCAGGGAGTHRHRRAQARRPRRLTAARQRTRQQRGREGREHRRTAAVIGGQRGAGGHRRDSDIDWQPCVGSAASPWGLAYPAGASKNARVISASHHGRFAGPNRLWFMPGTPAHVTDGEIVVAADRVRVRWAHEGVPKEGQLVLGGPAPSCRGQFTDAFHAPTGLVLHGHVQGSTLLLYGTYPAGDGSPDWGWRIVLDWCDPDRFGLRMFNVLPDGAEVLAVDLCGVRVG